MDINPCNLIGKGRKDCVFVTFLNYTSVRSTEKVSISENKILTNIMVENYIFSNTPLKGKKDNVPLNKEICYQLGCQFRSKKLKVL